MDKTFDKHVLHIPEVRTEVAFDTKENPFLEELLTAACFLKRDYIESFEPRTQDLLVRLENIKIRILEKARRRMEECERGRIEPTDRTEHTLTMDLDGNILVENRNGTKNTISSGMAIEATRWLKFTDIDLNLGRHQTDLLQQIVKSNALAELEYLRDEEIAIIMTQEVPIPLANSFKSRYESMSRSLEDKRGGEIAEELVASFLRVVTEDGILPFKFKHADIIDDVMYGIDYLCVVPYEYIPERNQKPGRTACIEAIQFTVQQDHRALERKSIDVQRIMTTSRNDNRPDGDKIDRAELMHLHLPKSEGTYVKKWKRELPNNFRGPEMALDAPTRELIFRKVLERVCWFWTDTRKDQAMKEMKEKYRGMYRE